VKVLLVAGARPNFMKVAPILAVLRTAGHQAVLLHTGQHYDIGMSDVFFEDLALPEPDFHLGVGSATHAEQTARIMMAFEPVLRDVAPDWVLVVGDVNSALAAALVTSKLRSDLRCRLVHVEAGVRSGDWAMPEEVNRVLTDQIADLLLTPSRDAHINLAREGIDDGRVVFVGNVMTDSLLAHLDSARARDVPATMGLGRGAYVVVSLHRPSNVDNPASLTTILGGFAAIAERMPVVFPLHPRTRRNLEAFGLTGLLAPLRTTEPLGYLDMLSLVDGAAACLTDSGGLQGETTVLGVPCVTLRKQTEWPATLEQGTNHLVPWPMTVEGIVEAFEDAVRQERSPVGARIGAGHAPPVLEGWDGRAAERVVQAMVAMTTDVRGTRNP
jgi:UDP-N-acetylglucosamine 2-epimerase (non-hydrolysing)